MSTFSLTVKLPPEGTLLRDLAVTSLLYVSECLYISGCPDVSVEWQSDVVMISASTQAPITDAFRSLYEEAAEIAEQRVGRIRLGMLQNDQQVMSKLLRHGAKGFTYLDAIKDFLRAYLQRQPTLSSLNQVVVGVGGMVLGQGGFVALNPLVAERYEYGLEFWRLNYSRKFRVELDETWYALVLAGLALTASAFVNDELLIIYLPEELIRIPRTSKIFEVVREAFGGLKGLHKEASKIVYEERCLTEPFPAFVMLLSCNLAKKAREFKTLYILNSLPIALCRLRRAGNVFTMVDKRRAELFDVVRFTAKLAKEDTQLIDELIRVCRRTLQLAMGIPRRGDEPDFTVYNRFCTLLLQAIQGAYPPYDIAYYGARYQLISKPLTEAIIRALSA